MSIQKHLAEVKARCEKATQSHVYPEQVLEECKISLNGSHPISLMGAT